MIKSNELRTGNWVNRYGDNHKISVETIFLVEKNELKLLPIPLTPEILEKAGFKSDSHFDGYALNIHDSEDGSDVYLDIQIYFTRTTGGGIIPHPTIMQGYDGGIYELHPHATIKFVHQLQNLYFSLTGEELNITL